MSVAKRQMQVIKESNYDLFDPANIFPEVQATPAPLTAPILTTPELALPIEKITIEEELEIELPTEIELYEIFDRLNVKYFKNQIPRINIKYSKRMMMAGSFSTTRKEITIGWKYHQIFREDIEDTMAHEMIHYFYPNHGRRFKDMANRFSVSLKAKEHPDLRLACKYLYYCPGCNKEYPRRKRLRMASCGSCTTGKKFDARFKLKLFSKK